MTDRRPRMSGTKIITSQVETVSGPNKAIVYVHGIGRHGAGFSHRWFAAMQPHLKESFTTSEVVWSHHVNPLSAVRILQASPAKMLQMEEFKRAILEELQGRHNSLASASLPHAEGALGLFDGSGLGIDDFVRYMLIEPARNDILAEFELTVQPLLLTRSGGFHIISHSWGSVVAYEGLRRQELTKVAGHVANLFMVGCPLSLTTVQSNLFERLVDGRLPSVVNRMVNLNAGGDLIGGSIAGSFAVQHEYLGLEPIGCATWPKPFDKVARSVTCAHSSYFHQDNVRVNRDVFARHIN
jgi:hypothetical protein